MAASRQSHLEPDTLVADAESYKGPSVSAALRTEAACAPLRTEAMYETAGPGFRLKSVIFKENLSVSVKAPVVKTAWVVKKPHRRLRPFAWD
jgi:hypothetical protein